MKLQNAHKNKLDCVNSKIKIKIIIIIIIIIHKFISRRRDSTPHVTLPYSQIEETTVTSLTHVSCT